MLCWQSSLEQFALKINPNLLQPRAPAGAVGRDVACSADALLTPEQLSVRAKITLVWFPRQLKRKHYFKQKTHEGLVTAPGAAASHVYLTILQKHWIPEVQLVFE